MGFYRTLKTEHRKPRECGTLSPVHDWNTTTINGAVQTRTHGPAHELLTMAGAQVTNSPRTLTYDTKGNMTTDDRGCGMTWDFDNMLQSFAANGVTDLKNATYEYDAIGRRVAKNVAETGGTQTTVFVQADEQELAFYRLSVSQTIPELTFLFDEYIDGRLMMIHQSTSGVVASYLHSNIHYSLLASSDSIGAVNERYCYESQGLRKAHAPDGTYRSEAAAINAIVGLTSRIIDGEVGTLFMRARSYCSRTGRFLSRDPLKDIDGHNLYSGYFVGHGVDPSGQFVIHAACAAACLGCAGVHWIGDYYCGGFDDPAEQAECMQIYWDGLPWLHKKLHGAACVGCIACLVRYTVKVAVIVAPVLIRARPIVQRCCAKIVEWGYGNQCNRTWAAYKAASSLSAGCLKTTGCAAATAKCAAATIEVAGRGEYLRLRCDYKLAGSICAGSAMKEANHRIELGNKTKFMTNCCAKAASLCLTNPNS